MSFKKAIFAGGCFWCMEQIFSKAPGVAEVVSGYTGGQSKHPSYQKVSSGLTKHREAVKIKYDPKKIGYGELVDIYIRNIDPTDDRGQFSDRGKQYSPAVFFVDKEQEKIAREALKALSSSSIFDRPVRVELLPAVDFYEAEEEHRDYHRKNPLRYDLYKKSSGRESFVRKMRPRSTGTGEENSFEKRKLRTKLTDLQWRVTQNNETEKPFRNKYWKNDKKGIYVDIVSKEPLFSSEDKFDSGTGWPSFTRPIEKSNIVEKDDFSCGMARKEIRSRAADSHLGHVFQDASGEEGRRYCVNSAALEFIPLEDMEERSYGKYKRFLTGDR